MTTLDLHPLPRKIFKGSKIRQERWLRNYKDIHDPGKEFPGHRFGFDPYRNMKVGSKKDSDTPSASPNLPSELLLRYQRGAKDMLDPIYRASELQFFSYFFNQYPYGPRNPPNFRRKDLNQTFFEYNIDQVVEQIIFTPQLALYLIFASEDDILRRYLRTWAHLQPHISLKIPIEMITADLYPLCTCSGCFGACVRIADKYKILPPNTPHEDIEDARKFIKQKAILSNNKN